MAEAAADNTEEKKSTSYESFVEEEIKSWQDSGVEWKPPATDEKYTTAVLEELVVNAYQHITTDGDKTPKFVKLLLMLVHQCVVGRLFATYAQIPEELRSGECTTLSLLQLHWNEKKGKKLIPVDFRRVYLIFMTNYLNRMWQFSDVNLKEEALDPESQEYQHIQSIQSSLDEMIDATQMSTPNNVKLSKAVVFEKIAENCCSLTGAMIDAMCFKYNPVVINNLHQLYNVISLISLRINQLYLPVEKGWLNDPSNYRNNRFKDKGCDDNFVTLVLSHPEANQDTTKSKESSDDAKQQ